MLRTLTALAITLTLSPALPLPAAADILVETSLDPLPEHDRASETAPNETPASAALSVRPRRNTAGYDWFIPRFRVDRSQTGDTTLLAIRAPGSVRPCDGIICTFNVEVLYYDVRNVRQHVDHFNLSGHQVQTINVRDVPGLAVDPDGFARGMIRVVTNLPMNVDYFQVDTSGNLATGGEALGLSDLCETWAARFLTFGPGQGTVLSIFVREPLGSAPRDPATVVGLVYNESGTFINSFTVRTDDWAFDLPVEDLVVGGTQFGTVELTLFDERDDAGDRDSGGLVTVSHAAESRFSIGARAFCTD